MARAQAAAGWSGDRDGGSGAEEVVEEPCRAMLRYIPGLSALLLLG